MLKTKEQIHWTEMYAYQTDAVKELLDVVVEYIGECEHQGDLMELCTEVSSDTVDDVEAWKKKRRKLLLMDLGAYLENSL